MAVNILRGRDHGLPGYAAARKQFRLDPVTEFSQINLFRGFQTNITEHQVLVRRLKLKLISHWFHSSHLLCLNWN